MPRLEHVQEETFCIEYSKHKDGQRAVIAAGYNCKTWLEHGSNSACVQASKLLRLDKVKQRIQEIQEIRARKADVSEVYVLSKLKRIVSQCMSDAQPVLAGGEPTGEYKFDSSGANKALQMIGDYLKMWTPDKQPVQGNVTNTQINIYMPQNDRHGAITNGERSHGSAGAGSTLAADSRAQSGLCLPSNSRH